MRADSVSRIRRMPWISLLIPGFLITLLTLSAYAQRIQGEIMVNLTGLTADVSLTRSSPHAFGTMCSWYPQDPSYLGDYLVRSVSTFTYFQFVDRGLSCPWPGSGTRTFGYGVYEISVGSGSISVDFRDADYGTLTGYNGYQDMRLYYTSGNNYFTDYYGRHINFGTTYHVWDMEPKDVDAYPIQVPMTITDNYNGGIGAQVKVDGTNHICPFRACFNQDQTITVEPYICPPPWTFDHWSDGGARTHTVTVGLDKFGYVLTAFYTRVLRPSTSLSAAAYPNPFNPTTKITYSITECQSVKVAVVDILGRQVQVLQDGQREPGTHEVIFDGTFLSSGVYFYRVQTAEKSLTRPLLLVK